jgi:hypothetical protein
MPTPPAFSEAEDAIIRDGVLEGLSYASIAEKIGRGKTRCSIIGRGRRLGLSNSERPAKPRVAKDRAPHIAAKRRTPVPALPAKPVERVAIVEKFEPELVPIDALTPTICRWPCWADDASHLAEKLYCGAEVPPGQPYCAFHKAKLVGRREP